MRLRKPGLILCDEKVAELEDCYHTMMIMMRTVTVMIVMMSLSEAITKFDRRRQIEAGAGGDLLASHCIERAACMRRGDNMLG